MDVLGDILASLRLTGGVILEGHARGDWCVTSQFMPEDVEQIFPGCAHVIAYHYIQSGTVYADIPGHPPVRAPAGSIILLPRNDRHRLYTEASEKPVDSHEFVVAGAQGEIAMFNIGEGEESADFYCGFLGAAEDNHPLLESLPPILLIEDVKAAQEDWLESNLKFLTSSRQSSETIASVASLLFAQAIRSYLDELGPGEGGWLAGLRDPAVAKALGYIHGHYAEDLDVEMIAREAGLSRSVLGERFAALLGEPPMRYCAGWRMRQAANMLRDGRENTANIAYAVGFNSEAAFNRAFKREYGEPPVTWKRKVSQRERAARERSAAPALPQQVVRYCNAPDGTRLAFSVVGEGTPLVKTANWLNHIEYDFDSPLWRHWLRLLTEGRCLVRYDERATGMSDWETPEISLDAFVDDLAAVVDCAGIDSFDLFAISQGAAVAIAYAIKHPERVRRLVICNGYACGWAVRADPDELAKREAMLTLTEMGWGLDNPTYRQIFTGIYIPDGTHVQMDWFNEMQRRSASPQNAVKLQRTLGEIDVRPLLSQVRTPTLVFHSRNDQAVPFAQGELIARQIPGAAFVPLDSRNHILLDSEPAWEVFSKVTREFLDAENPTAHARTVGAPAIGLTDEIHRCSAEDGSSLAYALSGEGFPLVKTQNWITHLDLDRSNPAYRHWIAEGERNNRFLRMDMRGFGLSQLDPPSFTFESMVGDLATTIDDAGLERCDLLGVSHGAALAIAYAARNPDRVRRLVLVNGFAEGWRVRNDPEEVAWRLSLMEMNQREWSFRRSLLGEMFIALYFPNAGQELIEWYNRHFEELGPVPHLLQMIEIAADVDVRNELPKIQAETLVVHAKQDGNAPLKAGKAMADAIAGARFVEVDSANHVLLGDEPAWRQFIREFRAFMEKESSSPRVPGEVSA